MIQYRLTTWQLPLMQQTIEWIRFTQEQAFLNVAEFDQGPCERHFCRSSARDHRLPATNFDDPRQVAFLAGERHFNFDRSARIGRTKPVDISVGLGSTTLPNRPLSDHFDRSSPKRVDLKCAAHRLFVGGIVTGIGRGDP